MQFLHLTLFWVGLLLQGKLTICRVAELNNTGSEKQETIPSRDRFSEATSLLKTIQTAFFSHNKNFHRSKSTNMVPKRTINRNSRIRSIELLPLKLTNSGQTEDKKVEDLSFEKLWLTGRRAQSAVQMKPEKPRRKHTVEVETRLNEVSVKESLTFDFPRFTSKHLVHTRHKRYIFGRDTRILIPKEKVRWAPFSSVVMISTGCTGSLISPRHVLTSAHCLNNGSRYLAKNSRLRVGFLRKKTKRGKSVKWVRVRSVNIPNDWTRRKSTYHDYAVLELIRPQKKRPYMEIGIAADSKTKMHIHFASFPGDKARNTMWYTHCSARVVAGVIVSRCDATKGSSGAGVYLVAKNGKKVTKRVIVGVLKGSGSYLDSNHYSHSRNGATRITPSIAQQICEWVTNKRNCFFIVSKRKRRRRLYQ